MKEKIEEEKEMLGSNELCDTGESIETNLKYFELYVHFTDTAQSFTINKFQLADDISDMQRLLPEVFSIIGVYGSRNEILEFLKRLFEQPLPRITMKEGIFMIFNPENACGCLVYVTESRLISKNMPSSASKMTNTIIRILSDICLTNVCCISDLIASKWFFERNGKTNPFISKTHTQGQFDVERKEIAYPTFENIELKSKIKNRKVSEIISLTKSNIVFFGSYETIKIYKDDAEYSTKLFKDLISKMKDESDELVINNMLHSFISRIKHEKYNTESLKRSILLAHRDLSSKLREFQGIFGRNVLHVLKQKFYVSRNIAYVEEQLEKINRFPNTTTFKNSINNVKDFIEYRFFNELGKILLWIYKIN